MYSRSGRSMHADDSIAPFCTTMPPAFRGYLLRRLFYQQSRLPSFGYRNSMHGCILELAQGEALSCSCMQRKIELVEAVCRFFPAIAV